jgi:hypothetical protein
MDEKPPESLNELLDRIDGVAQEEAVVSLEDVMEAVGRKSFGPLLLLVGVITVAPGVGDIPGVPTVLGLFVLVVSVQLLFGRKDFWLPQWMLDREVKAEKLRKMAASKWTRKPAKWIDGLVVERLRILTGGKGAYAIAVACTMIGLALPFSELVPLSTSGVSLGLLAFGISLVAHDGLMAVVGFAISAVTVGLLVWGLV